MRNLCAVLVFCLGLVPSPGRAQEQVWEIESVSPQNEFVYDLQTGAAIGTNGVIVKYGGAILTADRVMVEQKSGEAVADGNVRIQRDEQVWVGEHIRYNFKTRIMQADQFRSGRPPVFMSGRGLGNAATGDAFLATNAITTTDDISEPVVKIRTRKIKIVPGKYLEASNSLLFVDGVPVFYLPYYRRSLEDRGNHFNVVPGYRSRYGAFLLGSYDWFWNEYLDGVLHLDYRVKRGVGAGGDFNYNLGRWGGGAIKYYYLHDLKPGTDDLTGATIPNDRQRVYFSYLASPFTNFTARSQVRYQKDESIIHDFFESEYRKNPQPSTYVELNKFWQNFSLDTYVQPRVNEFYNTVERLPDIRLTAFRQQIGSLPFYYQSESSFAYLRRRFAVTNDVVSGLNYDAARADTYHQLLLPYTLWGWLNVTPHAGGRFTYYTESQGQGGTYSQASRGVFDTGVDVSFKASRLWSTAKSKLLDLDGLRHIVEPSVKYLYVPEPEDRPYELPQFDYTIPSLRLLPIGFPEFNSIDSIDSENTLRFGLRNTLQTKREGELAEMLNWEIYSDWNLCPRTNQACFSDVYSLLTFAPRSWLTLGSETSYDTDQGRWRLAYNTLTFTPSHVWKWQLGYYYLHDDPQFGTGNNLISSDFAYRLNENWSVRLAQRYEARDGRMEEQEYAIYRDLRSWTAELLFRWRDHRDSSDDFTVAFVLSLKAYPRQLGSGGSL